MPYQPGDMILTGQLDGTKVGQLALELIPAAPHEGPPLMPRFMAKRLFPKGFLVPQQLAQVIPAQQLVPAVGIQKAQPAPAPANNNPVQPVIVQANHAPDQVVNQVQPRPVAQYGYRRAIAGGEPIRPVAQRIRLVERRGI